MHGLRYKGLCFFRCTILFFLEEWRKMATLFFLFHCCFLLKSSNSLSLCVVSPPFCFGAKSLAAFSSHMNSVPSFVSLSCPVGKVCLLQLNILFYSIFKAKITLLVKFFYWHIKQAFCLSTLLRRIYLILSTKCLFTSCTDFLA